MEQGAFTFDRSKYQPDFWDWLSLNWHVWEAFCREANKVWARGRRRYSARTIVEVLRHESSVREVGGEWKITNNVIPDLARYYMDSFRGRDGFFETRIPHNAKRAA